MTQQFRAILALLVVTMVWGRTFPAAKSLTAYFSPAWIGEPMTWQAWTGAALLISGMIVSQWKAVRPGAVLAPE